MFQLQLLLAGVPKFQFLSHCDFWNVPDDGSLSCYSGSKGTVMDHYFLRYPISLTFQFIMLPLFGLHGCVVTTMLVHIQLYMPMCRSELIWTLSHYELITKTTVAFWASAVKKKTSYSLTRTYIWGETGGLTAVKPQWIRRIDFKDKLIYTQLFTSGMLIWGC